MCAQRPGLGQFCLSGGPFFALPSAAAAASCPHHAMQLSPAHARCNDGDILCASGRHCLRCKKPQLIFPEEVLSSTHNLYICTVHATTMICVIHYACPNCGPNTILGSRATTQLCRLGFMALMCMAHSVKLDRVCAPGCESDIPPMQRKASRRRSYLDFMTVHKSPCH